MTPQQKVQIEEGVQHLHGLGPCAVAEFLTALAEPVGDIPLLIGMLQEYRCITPAMLRVVGGDRFPPRLSPVPYERGHA